MANRLVVFVEHNALAPEQFRTFLYREAHSEQFLRRDVQVHFVWTPETPEPRMVGLECGLGRRELGIREQTAVSLFAARVGVESKLRSRGPELAPIGW